MSRVRLVPQALREILALRVLLASRVHREPLVRRGHREPLVLSVGLPGPREPLVRREPLVLRVFRVLLV